MVFQHLSSWICFVFVFHGFSAFAQTLALPLSAKAGVYAYQNAGLKGGIGISIFPKSNYKQLGFKAGYTYYYGDIDSRFNKVIDQYQGFELGISRMNSGNKSKSGVVKQVYRGWELTAFYSTNGTTQRGNWGQLKDCNIESGPSVSTVSKNRVFGVEAYGRISRGVEKDKTLMLFSLMPGIRYIKSTSSYSVHCDPSLVDESSPNENVSNVAIPLALKFQMDIFLKLKAN